jgi:uncharacterized protein YuzE
MGYLLKAVSHLVQLPKTHLWLDYNENADSLHVLFENKPTSDHSEMRDDGDILGYKDRRLIGITILDASQL